MTRWRIHYQHGMVEGHTAEAWVAAPDEGVQVVVEHRTPILEAGERRWTGVTDRLLWTGTDTYDPFGYGMKRGSLLPDEEYARVWEEAKTWPL